MSLQIKASPKFRVRGGGTILVTFLKKAFIWIPEIVDYRYFFPKKTGGCVLLQQHPLLAHKQSQWLKVFHFLLRLYSTIKIHFREIY